MGKQLNFGFSDLGDLSKKMEDIDVAIYYALEDGRLTADDVENMSFEDKVKWFEDQEANDYDVY